MSWQRAYLESLVYVMSHKHGVRWQYARAIVTMESKWDASLHDSPCCPGLFQVHDSVRKYYNRVHGTSHTKPDMFDAYTNAEIGLWQLNLIGVRIAKIIGEKNTPTWSDLATLSWLAGWATKTGVPAAITSWKRSNRSAWDEGDRPTLDEILAIAHDSGAAKVTAKKVRNAKAVTVNATTAVSDQLKWLVQGYLATAIGDVLPQAKKCHCRWYMPACCVPTENPLPDDAIDKILPIIRTPLRGLPSKGSLLIALIILLILSRR